MLMSRLRPLRAGLLAAALALPLSLAACSSDTAEPAPSASEQTPATQSTTQNTTGQSGSGQTTSAPASSSASSGAVESSTAKALSCRDFRALEDDGRAAAVAALGVKSNADQVATVAATVCLSRLDDKVADVVGELVPTR